MPSWKLTVEYHGAAFCGWQRQPNGVSLQEVLEDALKRLHGGEHVHAQAAGRTDAGVHARAQGVSIHPQRELTQHSYLAGLNSLLPAGVAVRGAEQVPSNFCARRWARGKRYVYRVLNARVRSPLRADRTWLIRPNLDVAAMQEAASMLVGRHAFDAFRAAGCQATSTERDLWRLSVDRREDEVVFVFEGSAFLRHMVRNIVGTLVDVGRGRRTASSMRELLASRDRSLAGRTAAAQGLCLDEVFYDLALGPPVPLVEPGGTNGTSGDAGWDGDDE